MHSASDAREDGIIKSIIAGPGYGFIRRSKDAEWNARPDIFVHASECNNRFDELKPGVRVEFSVGECKHGRIEAKNVEILK